MMQLKPHQHGGQLQAASLQYNIPLNAWIDLSTGISPVTYPLPTVPTSCWQRLPELNDGLEAAAQQYYGSDYLLPVSGSQEAIQRLPLLYAKPQTIGIIEPAYHSHQHAWQQQGHTLVMLQANAIEEKLDQIDILLIVNPTNPSALSYPVSTLKHWHNTLAKKGGTLIVDEAFIDTTPDNSLITPEPKTGLIVLRSVGKFFGLAGIRLGFVWATPDILTPLQSLQDDWSVSHPARWAGTLALNDTSWHAQHSAYLKSASHSLNTLLAQYFKAPITHTDLFSYIETPHAQAIHEHLAQQGIFTRLFNKPAALRFGLPESSLASMKLKQALESLPSRVRTK